MTEQQKNQVHNALFDCGFKPDNVKRDYWTTKTHICYLHENDWLLCLKDEMSDCPECAINGDYSPESFNLLLKTLHIAIKE